MSGHRRPTSGLASSLWVASIVALATGLALSAVGGGPLDEIVATIAVVPVAATIGALIVARVQRNPVGWIFLGVGVLGGLQSLAAGYADYSLPSGAGSRGLGELAAWLSGFLWAPLALAPLTFALLLFPDGRLPSRRWRPFAWLAGVGIAGVTGLVALNPDTEDNRWGLEQNPYGLEGGHPLLAVVGLLGAAVLPALVGSVAALIVRFRRSRGVERQQLKWLAYGGTIAAAVSLVAGTAFDEGPGVAVLIAGAQSLIPISIGIAILRHRLYDIDVVINRTLVYGGLTATLAGAYLGSVLVLQLALSGVTEGSGFAVAASTLAVAALFRPARTRIQEAVDRRFFRRKYDAVQTLQRFGAQLRDEVDLDALRADLRRVVANTMQPAHVSVWLRAPKT